MLSQLSRPLSKTSSLRRPTNLAKVSLPTLRPQKRIVRMPPVKVQPIVIDILLGSIALYLIVDVGSVFYKQHKNKENKED